MRPPASVLPGALLVGILLGVPASPALAESPAPLVMPNLAPPTSVGLDAVAFLAGHEVDGEAVEYLTLGLLPRLTVRLVPGLGLFGGLGGVLGLLASGARHTPPAVGYLSPFLGATFARTLGAVTLGADFLVSTPLNRERSHDDQNHLDWSPGDSCPTSIQGRCLRGALDLRYDHERFFIQTQIGGEYYSVRNYLYQNPVVGRFGLGTGFALGQGTWWGLAEVATVIGIRESPACGTQLDLGLARATHSRLAFRLSVPIYPRSNDSTIEIPYFMLGISVAHGYAG